MQLCETLVSQHHGTQLRASPKPIDHYLWRPYISPHCIERQLHFGQQMSFFPVWTKSGVFFTLGKIIFYSYFFLNLIEKQPSLYIYINIFIYKTFLLLLYINTFLFCIFVNVCLYIYVYINLDSEID